MKKSFTEKEMLLVREYESVLGELHENDAECSGIKYGASFLISIMQGN